MSEFEFSIDRIVLCDYVTQDISGRPVFVGVYDRHSVLSVDNLIFPPVYISVSLSPKIPDLEFSVELMSPERKSMLRGKFRAKVPDAVPPNLRVNVNFNAPPFPFPGYGEYRVVVRNKADRVVHTASYYFENGDPNDVTEVEIHGSVQVNPDFMKPSRQVPENQDTH